jgi:hypothetical protein
VAVGPKANSFVRWVVYKDLEEAIDDIGDRGFEDEDIGHREGFRQPRN